MARSTVVVDLKTRNPEAFLKLCDNVVEKNTELGMLSPFVDGTLVNMTQYAQKVAKAREQREKALEYYAMAEVAMAESRAIMGIHSGQTINTPGTLYNLTSKVKKVLLLMNMENPEALSPWGFNVVVRTVRRALRKKQPLQQ